MPILNRLDAFQRRSLKPLRNYDVQTPLGYFPLDDENHIQIIGSHRLTVRACVRKNVAPGRDRVFTNGLTFLIGERGIYHRLGRIIQAGEAIFTLRSLDGRNVLVNMKVEKTT